MALFKFIIGLFVGVGGLMLLLQIIQLITSVDKRERTIDSSSRRKDR